MRITALCDCCRYQGRREETNMVLVNIKLLSGYVLDKSSLTLVSWPAAGAASPVTWCLCYRLTVVMCCVSCRRTAQ